MKSNIANIVNQNPTTNRDSTGVRRLFQAFISGGARSPGPSGLSTRRPVRRSIHSGRGMLLAILAIVLIAGLGSMLVVRVTAQNFTVLHSFSGTFPQAGLILSSNTLYGTSAARWGSNTVFKLNADGTGFTTLYSFTALPPWPRWTNSDGAFPDTGVILSGNTLYGTCLVAGSGGGGTVFAVSTDGTGFTLLHDFTADADLDGPFTNSDGAGPNGLILSGNTLFGTASGGGTFGEGTVFAISTNGTSFTTLHSFTATDPSTGFNSDGASPMAGLILSGNTLYGTAVGGGANGTIFAVNTDGTDFMTVYNFNDGSDGAGPNGLILSGSTLYGTAGSGGGANNGTVFKINTDGTGFTVLHSFTAVPNSPPYTNSDGIHPYARGGLILSGNTLYGTASQGGGSGNGTVFAVNTDGTGFTTLYSFTAGSDNSSGYYTNSDGVVSDAGLVLSGNTFYGTASSGGSSGNGTVFSLSFPPQLTITPSGAYVVLTWPTNYAGFDYTGFTLQSTTSLVSPTVWASVSPEPVLVNGENTVIVPISGSQQFYRLRQQTQQIRRCSNPGDCPPGGCFECYNLTCHYRCGIR